MILRDLVKGVEIKEILGGDNLEISGITYNSEEVRDRFLFVAIRGEKADGHTYIGSAVKNGAGAILLEKVPENSFGSVSIVRVPDTKSALATISANYYRHPTKGLTLVGVTGTNGKTTVSYLLESIWEVEGKSSGVVGTIEYRYMGKKTPAPMTTPESLDLMKLLKDMKDSGTEYVVMEVSSHALDRKRVSACHFDAAIFTNLTQDHLDYHVNMENYFEAKKRLFTEVLEASEKRNKFAIINLDDAYGARIAKCSAGEVISFSTKPGSAAVHAERATINEQGIWADVNTPWGRIELHSKLFGIHNLSNILAASATALSLGASPSSVESGVSRIISVPGRLDRVENTKGINVLVDYAHTPDALKNVLSAVRPLTPGSLILVFGCGGDRDPLKRPVMGRIGRELSDVLIVTSDNPRTEPPDSIIDQIERGVFEAVDARKSYFRVTDRRQAIEKAIRIAQKGDTVLIAGKGHEDYQILGTKKIHFDDKEVARGILSEIDKEECLN